jgi:hypothetical protein
MKVRWEGLSHILWKIKFMFQTTNQNNILVNIDITMEHHHV